MAVEHNVTVLRSIVKRIIKAHFKSNFTLIDLNMRRLMILFFGMTLLNSCGNSNEENNVKPEVNEVIESDSIIDEKITYGVIAKLSTYDSDEKIVLPLYRTKNLIAAEDSIFIISYIGIFIAFVYT